MKSTTHTNKHCSEDVTSREKKITTTIPLNDKPDSQRKSSVGKKAEGEKGGNDKLGGQLDTKVPHFILSVSKGRASIRRKEPIILRVPKIPSRLSSSPTTGETTTLGSEHDDSHQLTSSGSTVQLVTPPNDNVTLPSIPPFAASRLDSPSETSSPLSVASYGDRFKAAPSPPWTPLHALNRLELRQADRSITRPAPYNVRNVWPTSFERGRGRTSERV